MQFRQRKAFTLVESLVVISIIVVLASIAFVAGAPSREKARQAVCMAQLRQMHMAVMMYSSDSDAGEEIPGLGFISDVPKRGIRVLDPYLKSKAIRYCPDLPAPLQRKLGTSYVWFAATPGEGEEILPGAAQMYAQTAEWIREWGTRFPMWVCTTHDQVYYQAREAHIHFSLAQPYIVEVALDGSVHSGRRPYTRGNSLNAYLRGDNNE
jgi:prepilin-type N-terminal cleavage/methylation domain-containing protein